MKKLIFPIIAALAAFSSCSTTEEITCSKGRVTVMLTGFTKADVDSAIAIQYTAGKSFSNIVDTLRVAAMNDGRDTFRLVMNGGGQYRSILPNYDMQEGYDYRLYFPRLNRWHEFTRITLAGNTHQTITRPRRSLKEYVCTDPVVSCAVDNTTVSLARGSDYTDEVFISK